ncbi:hypothetical protein BDD12DRAFT_817246 [Trichophaea hybrida]|nr:hypothetical protein BDD12DRAFT_817246 [Trichophaea hybrida]
MHFFGYQLFFLLFLWHLYTFLEHARMHIGRLDLIFYFYFYFYFYVFLCFDVYPGFDLIGHI